MKNLLLLLILANVLYFLWGLFPARDHAPGVVVINESQLGPALAGTANRDSDSVASVGAVLGSGEPSDLAAVVGRSCVTIGPFRASDDADEAISQYQAEGMRTALRSSRGEIFIGHWVQIRNIADREAGNEMLRKLQAGGLGDAYIVPNDDGTFNVSLGLFGELSRAERIELQAKSLDLPADITPRTREGDIYYVDIGLPPGKGAGAIVEKYGEERVFLRDEATCPASQ